MQAIEEEREQLLRVLLLIAGKLRRKLNTHNTHKGVSFECACKCKREVLKEGENEGEGSGGGD